MYQKSFLGYIHLDMPVSTYRSRVANLPQSGEVTLANKQKSRSLPAYITRFTASARTLWEYLPA
ncbi:MAG: hypothetical protein ACLSAP_05155 [Oscillospiraceae bacterium]